MRAKCRRNSVVVERIPLLNPAAREVLRQAGVKRGFASAAARVVEVKQCVSKSGKPMVKARVVKGRVSGGALRERRGSAALFPPPPPPPPMMDRGMFDPDPDMTPPPSASPRMSPAPSSVRPPPSFFGGLGCSCDQLGCSCR